MPPLCPKYAPSRVAELLLKNSDTALKTNIAPTCLPFSEKQSVVEKKEKNNIYNKVYIDRYGKKGGHPGHGGQSDKNDPDKYYILYADAKKEGLKIGDCIDGPNGNPYRVELYITRRKDSSQRFKGFQCQRVLDDSDFKNFQRSTLTAMGLSLTLRGYRDALSQGVNFENLYNGIPEPERPKYCWRQMENRYDGCSPESCKNYDPNECK